MPNRFGRRLLRVAHDTGAGRLLCPAAYLAVYQGEEDWTAADIAGSIVALGAVFIEALADRQMAQWRRANPNSKVRGPSGRGN